MGIIQSVIGFIGGIFIGYIIVLIFGALFSALFSAMGEQNLLSGIIMFFFSFPGEIITIGLFAIGGATGGIAFDN